MHQVSSADEMERKNHLMLRGADSTYPVEPCTQAAHRW